MKDYQLNTNRFALGCAQLATAGYLVYKGLGHGLPRIFGLRIEYHVTNKQNAHSVKKSGNILHPKYGGHGGFAELSGMKEYVNDSKNYIHSTGLHPKSKVFQKYSHIHPSLISVFNTITRNMHLFLYKTVGNATPERSKELRINGKVKFRKLKFTDILKSIFKNKMTKFYIVGTDSFFDKNFVPDSCSLFSIKTAQPLQVTTNRFSALRLGLKNFGLKGLKEKKSRVVFGAFLIGSSLYLASKLIKNGLDNLRLNK